MPGRFSRGYRPRICERRKTIKATSKAAISNAIQIGQR